MEREPLGILSGNVELFVHCGSQSRGFWKSKQNKTKSKTARWPSCVTPRNILKGFILKKYSHIGVHCDSIHEN